MMLRMQGLVAGRVALCLLGLAVGGTAVGCAESSGGMPYGPVAANGGLAGTLAGAMAGVGAGAGAAGVGINPLAGTTGGGADPTAGVGAVGGMSAGEGGAGEGGAGAIGGTLGGIGGEAAIGGMTGGAGGQAGEAASGGAGGSRPPTQPCTGKPGGNGNVTRTWNGIAQYITHYPTGADPNTPLPLVFVAHGFTMSGAAMQSLTRFDAVADRDKFVVVYPNGDGGAFPWDVGVGACAPGGLISAGAADSLRGYLDGMRAAIEADQCIDANAIFVTGFSMGGYFSHHVGCQRGNEFARAVGPAAGGTYPGACPAAPVPIFIMHGANDSFIDHALCGQGARDFWIPRNSCETRFETRMVTGGSCEWYQGCNPNGQTVYCEFAGVGHSWAGGATEAVWSFFKSYL